MPQRRRHATRDELELILVEKLGSVTHPSSVLDVLAAHDVQVDKLVKVIVDEPIDGEA